MIWRFTPSTGRLKDVDYFLPFATADSRTQGRNSTLQQVGYTDGEYDSSGTMPMPLNAFAFTTTHTLSDAWYRSNLNGINYYNNTNNEFVARENALLHLNLAIAAGGAGSLVDKLWEGVKDPVDGTPLTQYSANAKIGGDLQIVRKQGTAEVTINWVIPDAIWSGDNGHDYPAF